jgi:hypothetical protein
MIARDAGYAGPRLRLGAVVTVILVLISWGSAAAQSPSPAVPDDTATEAPSSSPEADAAAAERPEWFDLEMIDVVSGEPFTINDFAGQVVLLETMAVWCPTCQHQGDEVSRLHELLGYPDDLVSVSLDIDMGEDEALLRNYVEKLDYDWRFAVAPLLVARALGNLYSAQYLNPPVSPMLIIDRDGSVLGLPFGSVKNAESLQGVVEPLLDS